MPVDAFERLFFSVNVLYEPCKPFCDLFLIFWFFFFWFFCLVAEKMFRKSKENVGFSRVFDRAKIRMQGKLLLRGFRSYASTRHLLVLVPELQRKIVF